MRKKVMFSLMLTLCVVVLSFACVKTENNYKTVVENSNPQVLTVARNQGTEENEVLGARFLNMLNHNYVYNDAFYADDLLVKDSLTALCDLAEDSYVAETFLDDYIFNMYGKIYDGYDFLGDVFTEKEGYVYIAPRGYCEYNHKIVSINDNKDGSFTVITDVNISYTDGSEEVLKCETVFLKADDSAFGYNMMYSQIAEGLIGDSEC